MTEWECLALVWAIRKYREYLESYHFTVVTDHSSLRWMYRQKNPVGRVARWAMELAQYDFDIQHRKGSLHHVPDALSRMFEDESEGLYAITETNDAWYEKRMHPKLFKNWTVHEEKINFHNKDQLLDSLEIDDLDSWKLVVLTELRLKALRECHD